MTSLLLRDVRIVPIADAPAQHISRASGARPAGRAGATDGPVDVLLAGGRVRRIAPAGRLGRADLADLADGAPREVAAEGRYVVPGLWDQHVHLGQWSLSSARLDLAGVRSAAEACALVAERIAEDPDQPIVGWGHRSSSWDPQPLVPDLDAVAPRTPVVLISGDGHHAWLNTTALLFLALPVRETVVREGEWFAAYGRLATLVGNEGTSPAAYRRALEHAAGQGVVGLVDFEFSGGAAEWRERWAEGADLLRVRMATYADGLDDVLAEGLRTGDPLLPGDDRLTMGPLKIISDGSLNTRTAWCCAPYADAHRLEYPAGQPNQSGEELRALLARAHQHGLEAAVHAIGDAAVSEAIGAFADTGVRGSIEHAQLIQREDIARMVAGRIRASVQPAHLLDDRDVSEYAWQGRTERCFALRWMADAGVELAMGSDAPVSPLDPWLEMAASVHRSPDHRAPWHPEQSLTAAEALAASTDGAGTVAEGSTADLALLDSDPLAGYDAPERTAAALRETSVALTTVGGRVVHSAIDGLEVD